MVVLDGSNYKTFHVSLESQWAPSNSNNFIITTAFITLPSFIFKQHRQQRKKSRMWSHVMFGKILYACHLKCVTTTRGMSLKAFLLRLLVILLQLSVVHTAGMIVDTSRQLENSLYKKKQGRRKEVSTKLFCG